MIYLICPFEVIQNWCFVKVSYFEYSCLSAGTGNLCIFGHLGLVSVELFCFLSLITFVLRNLCSECTPVLTEGAEYWRIL